MAMFSEAGLTAVGIPVVSNRDKIKYLKRYITLDREIDRKLEEVTRWRSKLTRVTPIHTNEPKGGGSIRGKTEDIIAKIVDLEAEMNADIDMLVELKQSIENIIAVVEDDRERLLLQYRYLDGRTFEWIAAEMHYSWRQIHYIHVRGLKQIRLGKNVCT